MKEYNLGIETTLEILGGKWKALIICLLMSGSKRPSELQRKISGITRNLNPSNGTNHDRKEIMRYYVLVENPIRTKLLVENLTAVWEASVRATHEFLNENDIIALRPFVETALREVEHLIVAYENHGPVGFMGIDKDKLEMLFLDPHCIGTGIGKRLITKAILEYGVLYVDVNEQNPKAEKFYYHFGFTLYERTEADDMGNPFPVLKLKLRK